MNGVDLVIVYGTATYKKNNDDDDDNNNNNSNKV